MLTEPFRSASSDTTRRGPPAALPPAAWAALPASRSPFRPLLGGLSLLVALSFGPAVAAHAQAPQGEKPDTEVVEADRAPDAAPADAVQPRRRGEAASVTARRRAAALAGLPSRIAVQPPGDLKDLSSWLQYKAVTQRPALPEESRLFYRRGMMAWQAGDRDEAVRLVRGAAELDPTFSAPPTTLVSWFLFRDPGQALLEAAGLFQFARESFVFQLWLVANGAYLVLQSLFLGLLIAGMLVVLLRNAELRHGIQERLSIFLTPRAAGKWPWVFLVFPFVVGLGLAWPTTVLLALLWPSLKLRERALFVLLFGSLIAAPWVASHTSRLAAPLRHDEAPFYGVLALQVEPSSPEARARLERLAEQHPSDPLLQFARAWAARQANDLSTAEAAYRRAAELWPDRSRALNNLGNVLALEGKQDEAIQSYTEATRVDPTNAAPYFNLSQAHTLRFDYHAANEALARASALNFDMLRKRQEQSATDGHVLVDQWIAPRFFWQALLSQPHAAPRPDDLPPVWRHRIELSGWPYTLFLLVSVIAALAFGVLQNRAMPLRRCANCDRVVCRRCAERRRELALCRSCASTESRAEVADFARVLLREHRRKTQHLGRLARTALATLIPGFGLLVHRRVFTPMLLLATTAALCILPTDGATPYTYQPHFDLASRDISLAAPIAAWVLVYLISILGYFAERSRADARSGAGLKTMRSRAKPRHITPAAAA